MRNVAHRMANIPDVSVLTIEVRRLAEAIYEGSNRTRGQVDAEPGQGDRAPTGLC